MENEDEVVIDTPTDTEEETVEIPAIEDEGTQTPEVDVEQLQATNKKLFERAKKAEARLKELQPQRTEAKQVSPQINIEETVLLANGMPEELLKELKAVAQVRNTSLIKAQNDPIFVAVKEKFEKDQKKKDASLPASRGSGSVKVAKTINTPGLSRDEHKQMVMDSQR
jgi:hypothetical protein